MLAGTVFWRILGKHRLWFLLCNVKTYLMLRGFVQNSLSGDDRGSRPLGTASPLLPDPTIDQGTIHIKMSLHTRCPSQTLDEVLGRWEGCLCLRKGKMFWQASLCAIDSAVSCTHCSWTSRPAWAKPLSSPWRGSGHVAGRTDLCQSTLPPCRCCPDSHLSGNPCPETLSWPSHPAKLPPQGLPAPTYLPASTAPADCAPQAYTSYSIIWSSIKALSVFWGAVINYLSKLN